MAAGGLNDHPVSDILFYKIEVYGTEADELIRKIAALCSRRELYDWWDREIGWSEDRALALRKAKVHFYELSKRAKDSGWEAQS
jgi:hypothetical protein